jgi:hypothetical protein
MTVFPGMRIRENFGLVDVQLIRRIYLTDEEFKTGKKNDLHDWDIELATEGMITDLNEIVRTRVRSLGGNCLIGYKVEINGFDQDLEKS